MKYFILAILQAYSVLALAETNSDHYRWIEPESSGRQQFVAKFNAQAEAQLQADPNGAAIQAWLYRLNDVSREMKRKDIDATHTLILIDRGIGKPTQLVIDSAAGQQVLLSNSPGQISGANKMIDFGLSPDHRTAFVVKEKDGSIDQMDILLVDVATGRVGRQPLLAAQRTVAWLSSDTLVFTSKDKSNKFFLSSYNLKSRKTDAIVGGFLIDDAEKSAIISDGHGDLVYEKTLGDKLSISGHPTKIAGENDSAIFVWCKGPKGLGEIRRFERSIKTLQKGTVIVPEGTKLIVAVTQADEYVFVTVREGADRQIQVYDLTGVRVGEVPIPNCCTMTLSWVAPGRILTAAMTSAVANASGFNFDLQTGRWDQPVDDILMRSHGIDYVTEIVFSVSRDGTRIPMRLTRRKDLAADGSHPVYLNYYGGFSLAGHLDPSFSSVVAEFLRRGGILADPALRGGNEYGPQWHEQGALLNKINTYDDLHSAAQYLVQQNWTTAAKIISTGVSNGGLTAAATALLYPDDFGLVIPISGVLDMLGKDRLDQKHSGWDDEYGSETDVAMRSRLAAISPLENVRNLRSLRFLIVAGADDTRVNPVHSYKLAAALRDFGGTSGSVELVTLDHAGHNVSDISYQNSIGWHAQALIWAAIFKQSGWQW